MKKQIINLLIVLSCGLIFILGCKSADTTKTTTTAPTNSSAITETAREEIKPVAVQAKALTKEYEENELAADGKYKDKKLAVTGKVSNIAATLGNITVQLEGHNFTQTVMCSFDESEKAAVAKLKKGQQVTLVGTGEGSTGGLYVGLQNCKIQ